MKKITQISLDAQQEILPGLLSLSKRFSKCSILNSNDFSDKYGVYSILAGFGSHREFSAKSAVFHNLEKFIEQKNSWLFGHFEYDLKNEIEQLESNNRDHFNWSLMHFFEPQLLIYQKRGSDYLEIFAQNEWEKAELEELRKTILGSTKTKEKVSFPALKPRMTKEEYLESVLALKQQIQYGAIYEITYCQEFYAENQSINPQEVCLKLSKASKSPFAAFYRNNDNYLLGSSPERYLCKRGQELFSQPIKGTAKRGNTQKEDEEIKTQLAADLKEQTENVMIVDLVRNDLSRTAKRGSVVVEELFGVYSFPQVHQLISTIKSEIKEGVHFVQAIKNSFPMGSMTGAPKVSATKLIEQHEKSRRGLFSGSVGYISPDGDFDFNVNIRSLVYNADSQYLSLSVGGAITHLSEPEQEYKECLLKAKAIFDLHHE